MTIYNEGERDGYATVAAGQTDQVLGTTGRKRDYLFGLLIVPESTSPGPVSIKDGGGPAMELFHGGVGSVGSLVPFFVPVGVKSANGAWAITTGDDLSVVAMGRFS